MQSGTTGINAARIYNPVKQGYDQDSSGDFIRRWIPELAAVPAAFLHEPWRWPGAKQVLDKRYPAPILDHQLAAETARRRIHAIRNGGDHRDLARAVFERHGSRRRPRQRQQAGARQDAFDFNGETKP
jgi:deoxyribodipyrimidine photo-lyase